MPWKEEKTAAGDGKPRESEAGEERLLWRPGARKLERWGGLKAQRIFMMGFADSVIISA